MIRQTIKFNENILLSKRFLPLFITQFFGAFNDNLFKNAFLIWFTYEISVKLKIDAQFMVTIASGLFVLPFFLFSAFAGQVADKFIKSKIVHIIKIIEILIMIFALIGFYFENIRLLLFLVFLMGVHSTFFGPIKYSLLPEILKKNELIKGNGLIEGGTFLAILFGTILGGMIIRSKYGIEIVSILAILFALIGYFASLLIPKTSISDPNLKIDLNIFASTWQIIKFAKRDNSVWLSIIAISWFWFIGITFLSQFPIYTKNIINGNESIVTFFLSIFSIGIGIGSVMCNYLLKGQINAKLVPTGLIGISFGIIIFVIASKFYIAPNNIVSLKEFLTLKLSFLISFSLLMVAVFSGIYIVPLYTIMQNRSDIKYISRIIASNNILNAIFMVFSTFIIILLTNLNISLMQIFFILGISNFIIFYKIKKLINQKYN
jgi:MFS family permease